MDEPKSEAKIKGDSGGPQEAQAQDEPGEDGEDGKPKFSGNLNDMDAAQYREYLLTHNPTDPGYEETMKQWDDYRERLKESDPEAYAKFMQRVETESPETRAEKTLKEITQWKPDSPLWGALQQQIDRTEDPKEQKKLSEAKDSIREGEYDEDALPYRTLDQIEKFVDSKDRLRELMRAAQVAGAVGGRLPHPAAPLAGAAAEAAGKVGEKIINDKIKLVERELANRIEDLDPKNDADRIGRIQSILKRLRSSPLERVLDKK